MTAPPPSAQPDPVSAARPFPLALVAWAFIGLVLVLAMALVAVNLAAGSPPASGSAVAAAPPSVVSAVVGLPPAAFDAAGGWASAGPQALSGQSPLQSGGKVEIVFVGAESSPYSAAESWVLVAALSRFGTFSHLGWAASPATEVFGRTPGFSFGGTTFRSSEVALQSFERDTASLSPTGNAGYQALQEPDPATVALMRRYDVQGDGNGLPFLDVGNHLVAVGAGIGLSPGLLQGQSMSQVAARLADPADPAGRAVLAAADQIAAAICSGDGGRPGVVCASAGVRAAATNLGLS